MIESNFGFIGPNLIYLSFQFHSNYQHSNLPQTRNLNMSQAIKVVVRVRPMNTKQKERGCNSIITIDEQNNQISLTKPDEADNVKNFAFDNVFGDKSQQQLVYSKTAYNLVQNVLLGYNGTIFAYGQTGCGKTHSMVGRVDVQELQGIIPRSFGHILKTISQTKHKEFLIRCSFIEIYNEEVRDLLGKDVKNKLEVKESPDKGIFIKDLSMNTAKTHEQLMDYMNEGNKNRAVGETAMNKDSSRSHLLFMLSLQSAQITENDSEQRKYVASKLNLVDLAGSQRLSKTGAAGDRLKQAQKINLSLSALGNVISALVDGKSQHIPYRDSKLTRLLQDSLGGNTKTIMIANCSPADYNFDETLSTLRYASRAKFIKNKPIINQDPKDALLKQYAEEIKILKQRLQGQGGDIQVAVGGSQGSQQINAKLRQKQEQLSIQKMEKQKLQQKIRELEEKHLQAKDVHIDQKVKNKVERARISLQNNLNFQQMRAKKTVYDDQKMKQVQKISNSNEAIQQYKKIVQNCKTKIRSLQRQLKDINYQNYMDKQVVLDDLRAITKENKLLQGIINILLLPSQLETIKQAAQYNEERQEYKVPPFYMRNKALIFPKLQQNQSIEMIRQMQDGRKVVFGKQKQKQGKQNKPVQLLKYSPSAMNLPNYDFLNNRSIDNKKSEHQIRDIIKQARSQQNTISMPIKDEKRNPRKLQLEPLRKQSKLLQK